MILHGAEWVCHSTHAKDELPDNTKTDKDEWATLKKESRQCKYDTDGDGDCHLCYRKGGCFYKQLNAKLNNSQNSQ